MVGLGDFTHTPLCKDSSLFSLLPPAVSLDSSTCCNQRSNPEPAGWCLPGKVLGKAGYGRLESNGRF